MENKKGNFGVSRSTWVWSAALCPPGWGPGGVRSVPWHRVWVPLCSSGQGLLLAESSQGLLFNNYFNNYLHSTVLAASLLSPPCRCIPARPSRRPPALPITVCGQEVGRGWGCAPRDPARSPHSPQAGLAELFADPMASRDRLGAHPMPRLSDPIPLSPHSPPHKTPPGRFLKPPLPGVRVSSWKKIIPGRQRLVLGFPRHRAAGAGRSPSTQVPTAAPSTPPASASRGASALLWVWVWVRVTARSSQPPPVTGPGGKY